MFAEVVLERQHVLEYSMEIHNKVYHYTHLCMHMRTHAHVCTHKDVCTYTCTHTDRAILYTYIHTYTQNKYAAYLKVIHTYKVAGYILLNSQAHSKWNKLYHTDSVVLSVVQTGQTGVVGVCELTYEYCYCKIYHNLLNVLFPMLIKILTLYF